MKQACMRMKSKRSQEPMQQEFEGNDQRFKHLMIKFRRGNTLIRDGKCYLLKRSELDPRWPEPQFIDETIIDRSRLDSLNLQYLNPDVVVRNEARCLCTRLIDLRHEWYAHLYDGTILCSNCARCQRCFKLCFTVGRKLNSIDGFVLCNTCMLNYGCYRQKPLRLKIQPIIKTIGAFDEAVNPEDNKKTDGINSQSDLKSSEAGKSKNNLSDNSNNSNNSNNSDDKKAGLHEIAANSNDEKFRVLTMPRYRSDGRPPLRLINYPNPRPANYGRPDYKLVPPPFLGVDREASQFCPECKHQALTNAFVVPSSARVYHEKSFRCTSCQKQLYAGFQVSQVHFQSCSCSQEPKVWCKANKCRMARVAHHVKNYCTLAPVHPGGRLKRDVPGFAPRFDPIKDRLENKKELLEKKKPKH